MLKNSLRMAVWIVCITLGLTLTSVGQTSTVGSGTVRGIVTDPSGAVVPGATVEIQNPVSGYNKSAQTDGKGAFEFDSVPFNHYHTTVAAPGFQTAAQDIDVNSVVPLALPIGLKVGTASTAVTVTESGDLLATQPVTHTDIDRELLSRLPVESESSSLSSVVTLASPGIAADSNGLFHGLGDHAENSFSVDGQPITDQQSKVFSNQIPLDSVQSLQVIEGAPPAEYGDKTSTVIVVTTRSGMGITQPHGDVTASYGSFGSANGGFDLAYGGKNWGNFISANGLDTGRFLDGPEFVTLHDKGNEENAFDRIDFKTDTADTFNINLEFTRSWFQNPNSYDAQYATAWNGLVVDNGGLGANGLPVGPQDQRSQIRTFDIAPTWTRLLNSSSVFTLGVYVRQDQYNYYPSDNPFADFTPDLQSESIAQARRLTNAGAQSTFSYVKGMHNFKAGVMFEHTLLNENDQLGIVNPALNAVCLNSDGSANTNPNITDPSQCVGALSPNPNFIPLLGCLDLTRTATLPAADGCGAATSGRYDFLGHADIREAALYAEDAITKDNFTVNLGVRFDHYDGLTQANQVEPRLGVSYNIKATNTVLRLSYANTMETPFNENLVLASEGCNSPQVNALMSLVQGYPCLNVPLSPGRRNEYHAGLEQAFGRHIVFDGEYIWKYTDNAYDFSVLGNTPITFPIEWYKSKIPGFALRTNLTNWHGLSAFFVASSVAARFFTPQVSGIGATPTSTGGSSVFRIDHDERFNQTTHFQYQIGKNGPWAGVNWRYDSGLVAGAVPCAGGNCVNGPNGSDSIVDVSNLTPDQQFEAGLYCGNVFATPTTGISPNGLCPAASYGSTLLKIPAAGTENDDHNPPRVAPRNLFDLAFGEDNLLHRDKYRLSVGLDIINVANKEALYNFLSTFSGTHYVAPRTTTVNLGVHF